MRCQCNYVSTVDDTGLAMTNSNSKFLSGCKKIAEYIGETERRTFDLLSGGKIPAFKEGKLWRASKESLDRHYDKLESTFRHR